jgi:hypothetical protein
VDADVERELKSSKVDGLKHVAPSRGAVAPYSGDSKTRANDAGATCAVAAVPFSINDREELPATSKNYRGTISADGMQAERHRHATCARISIDTDCEPDMPDKKTIARAEKAKRAGKPSSAQAGEFVREEMRYLKEGKHRARSPKQAVAIGLSKARQAGVDLKPPKQGSASETARKKAKRDLEKGAERADTGDGSKRRNKTRH